MKRPLIPVLLLAVFLLPLDANVTGGWVGTWAAAPQAAGAAPQQYRNQTLRLIVHVSAGGDKVRITLSNIFGKGQVLIGAAHVARRASNADINKDSDHALTFNRKKSVALQAGREVTSDAVAMEVPALTDLAISLYLPEATSAATYHSLAKQTSYVAEGDAGAAPVFTVAKTISTWPFLTAVDVAASTRGAAIVAFGSSLTDGDGSTKDVNRRWPDVLAERLQKDGQTAVGVLNKGIIGNRLLSDTESPRQTGGPLAETYKQLGSVLGQSGLRRFERDVLQQAGVKYVILALGVNDILFPGSFIDASHAVSAQQLIDGNRELIGRAHKRGIRAIGTTIPPFEGALFRDPSFNQFYSPEKEKVREEVNAWVRSTNDFDGIIDFDVAVRDPEHPSRILPAFDSGDHLHVNDAGNVAQGNVIDLKLFRR